MLITSGKEGRILVLNRDNLGGFVSGASYSTNALQDITGVVPQAKGFWSTPAYWNGNVYMWAENNVPMLFKLNGGVMDHATRQPVPNHLCIPRSNLLHLL